MDTHTCPINHLHDLGITISAGDLEAEQIAALRTILKREVQALVDRANTELYPIMGTKVGWHVSYDGSQRCGEHR